jgi:uncharacterized membrane protein YjjP (DUF1212 family)
MAVKIEVEIFWNVTPCSIVFTLKMEAAKSSETLVSYSNTTRRYNLDELDLN